jgi:hypothetical protein
MSCEAALLWQHVGSGVNCETLRISLPHQDLLVGLTADYVCSPRLARRGLIQTPRSEADHP